MHTNCDLRFFFCMPPLGRTVRPITPVTGKGSRPRDWPLCIHNLCGKRATVGGQQPAKQGLFNIWYAIDGEAACSDCWMDIYDLQDDDLE
mgnify:CR=1 FL=1